MQRATANIDSNLPEPLENSFGIPTPDPWTAQSAMQYINEVMLKMLEFADQEADAEESQDSIFQEQRIRSLTQQKRRSTLSANARARKAEYIKMMNHWQQDALKVGNILNSNAFATNVVELRDTVNAFVDSSNRQLNATNEMMQAMVTRVTRVEHRLGILETKVDAIQSTLDSFESRMDSFESRMESRMDSIELRMESMEKRILTRMEELLNGRN